MYEMQEMDPWKMRESNEGDPEVGERFCVWKMPLETISLMPCIINHFHAFAVKGCSSFLPSFHFTLCSLHLLVGNLQ